MYSFCLTIPTKNQFIINYITLMTGVYFSDLRGKNPLACILEGFIPCTPDAL